MVKTPLEDFTTEILCGILSSDTQLGDKFVNGVLHVKGNDFIFSTQECFPSDDPAHPDSRVDLVIRSEGIICFVENKVESREGYIQLKRYARVLDRLSKTEEILPRLFYCTKYYDTKSISEHSFQQFRWADVYRFLLPFRNTGIINDYLNFLKSHDMSDELDLTLTDLMTMQGLSPVVKKLEQYLQKIRPVYARYFNPSGIKDSKNLDQIKLRNRYVFHAGHIFGNDYAELGAGFDFTDTPSLKIWIWVNDKNNKKAEFKVAIAKAEFPNNGDNWLGEKAPLSDFISAKRMDVEIEAWFDAKFQMLREFKDKHPELDWHI